MIKREFLISTATQVAQKTATDATGFRQPKKVPHDIPTRHSEAFTTMVRSVAGIAWELHDGFVAELKEIAESSLDHRHAGHLGDPTAWV